MNKDLQSSMFEATRLTREGKLAEATALIQSALGGGISPASPAANPGREFEVESRIVRETKVPDEPESPGIHSLRSAPVTTPPRPHRRGGAPGGAKVAPPRDVGEGGGGTFVRRTYANQAGSRAYRLFVPGGYDGREVSLVVMLHGCTQSAEDFAAGTQMNALAGEHRFIVLYPEQDSGSNMNRCWNWFRGGDQGRGAGEPSIIAGMTCEVIGEYNVAPGRVYIAGLSAGGAMAAVVADAYPDLYAAVGVHSGIVPGAARDMPSAFSAMQGTGNIRPVNPGENRVPAIIFHGDRDTTVSPKNAGHLASHYGTGVGSPHHEKDFASGGRAYTREVFGDPNGRATLEKWTVAGMGHAWSGGSRKGSYTDSTGPDASARMIEFFERNARDPLG